MTLERLGRPPRVVILATLAFGAIVAAWSVLTPLAEAPDEPAHLGLVLNVADNGGRYPDWDQLEQKEGAFWLCRTYAVSVKWCATPEEKARLGTRRERPAADAPPKDERPAWDHGNFLQDRPDRHNQMPQHPPLYYEAMASALRIERAVVPGTWSVDHELALLRLCNALILMPLPWLAWAASRRAGTSDRTASVAAISMLGVPQLTHIGGSLNNDNLLVPLVGVLAVLLAGAARGDRSIRRALWVGVALGASLLTKGFAVVLPPVVVAAYLVGAREPGGPGRVRGWLDAARRSAVPVAVAGVTSFVLAGWWYVANLVDTGKLMPSIEDARLTEALRPDGFHVSVWKYVSSFASKLVEGFWGSYGWRSVRLPWPVSLAATVLSLGFVVVAVRSARRRGDVDVDADADADDDADVVDADAVAPPRRDVLAICALPFVLFFGFVLVRSWVIYTVTGHLYFQQGRYLFAGIVGIAVVTAIGASGLLGEQRAVRGAFVAVLAIQAVGVLAALHGWWALGWTTGPRQPLRSVVAWNGWPDPIALILLFVPVIPIALLGRSVFRPQESADQSLT